ncbi:MAG: NUDIX hydrolase [Streptosporangiales bacterium]
MLRRHLLTGELARRARAHADGTVAGVGAKDASTVVLLRDGVDGLEVYLLRRVSTMAFAAGAYVFPGGGVDAPDREADIAWAGPSRDEWGERLGASPALAGALVCAAVRETFEEAGVLLAGTRSGTLVPDTSGREWEDERSALVRHELALAPLLRRRGLVLRSDLLGVWSRWITPDFEPRRYDTRFFVAALPGGQHAKDVSDEADQVAWMRPGDALAAAGRDEIALLPPTLETLAELSPYARAADVLAAAETRTVRPRLPQVHLRGDEVELVLPEGGEDRDG